MTESEQTPELAAAEKALLASLSADAKAAESLSKTSFPEYIVAVQEKLVTASQAATGYRKTLTDQNWDEATTYQLAGNALAVWQSYILRGVL